MRRTFRPEKDRHHKSQSKSNDNGNRKFYNNLGIRHAHEKETMKNKGTNFTKMAKCATSALDLYL